MKIDWQDTTAQSDEALELTAHYGSYDAYIVAGQDEHFCSVYANERTRLRIAVACARADDIECARVMAEAALRYLEGQ